MLRSSFVSVSSFVLLAGVAGVSRAQTATVRANPVAVAPPVQVSSSALRDPRAATALQLMQKVDVEFADTRLEDVFAFVKQVSQADMDILWADDAAGTSGGLNKDTRVTINKRPRAVLSLVEEVLDKANADGSSPGGNTWQMSEHGTFQAGPRERLNKFKRLEVYPISDLLMQIPDYPNAPRLDLNQALQDRSGGGGGGQNPFTSQDNQPAARQDAATRAQEVIDLVTDIVERDQWSANGGDGGTIRYFQGALMVNAPDYMHRGLGGYSWWPRAGQRVAQASSGRRYVTLGMSTGINKLDSLDNFPVTAVVPGTPAPPQPPPPNPCPNGDC